MKKHFTFSGILTVFMVVTAIFLSSCGSQSARTEAIYIAIPADAPFVLEVNINSLREKSNIQEYKDRLADMIAALDSEHETAMQLAEAIRKMDDGGLNLDKAYLFTTSSVDAAFLLASIRNAEEVDQTVLKVGGESLRIVEDEGDGLTWIEDENHKTIGVHDAQTLLLGTIGRKDVFEQLVRGGDGFFATRMGGAMIDHTGDITLMMNVPAINDKRMEKIRQKMIHGNKGKEFEIFENDEVWDVIRKAQMVWNITFSAGEVSLNIFNANEESVSAQVLTKVNSDVFKNIPSDGLIGALAFGIDGNQLAAIFRQLINQNDSEMDAETAMGLGLLSSLCSDMNGSAAIGISMNDLSGKPGIVALLPIAKDKIQFIYNMLTEDSEKDVYLTGDNTYSAISNNRAYQFGRVRSYFDKKSHADSTYLYGYFDIQQLLRLAIASKRGHLNTWDESDRILLNYALQFDYLEMKMASSKELSLILKLRDEQQNSLSVLLPSTIDLVIKGKQNKEERKRRAYMTDEEVDEVIW